MSDKIRQLVEVLGNKRVWDIDTLCVKWGITPVYNVVKYTYAEHTINYVATIQRLAQHALEDETNHE